MTYKYNKWSTPKESDIDLLKTIKWNWPYVPTADWAGIEEDTKIYAPDYSGTSWVQPIEEGPSGYLSCEFHYNNGVVSNSIYSIGAFLDRYILEIDNGKEDES